MEYVRKYTSNGRYVQEYVAKNGLRIKSNAILYRSGRRTKATAWYILTIDGFIIDTAPTLKRAKEIIDALEQAKQEKIEMDALMYNDDHDDFDEEEVDEC